MLDRFRNLPTWLRLLLAATPILICIPLTCTVVFVYQQYTGLQSATVTAAGVQTLAAQQATRAAQEAAAALTEAAGAAAASQATAAAEAGRRATGTAEALALRFQSLTETSAAQPTAGVAPTEVPSTETPTARPAVFATATPKTVTISLRECRGDEGTVLFGQVQPQSLHAFSILTFTVPPGTYHLQIDWLTKPQNKVDINVDASTSQSISFGDQCQ